MERCGAAGVGKDIGRAGPPDGVRSHRGLGMTGTASLVRACSVTDLQDGEIRRVEVPDQPPIAIYRLGDEYYATDDTCTHGAASLADGFVENGEVECPFHLGRFDIRTGQPTLHPCTVPIRTYKVQIDGSEVFVDTFSQDPGAAGRRNGR